MGAGQRRKGAAGEREAARLLSEEFGIPTSRTLGQSRDGGRDIHLPPFCVEVKRRKGIAAYEWVKQAKAAAKPGELPIVLARADGEGWLCVMPWDVAARLMRGEIKGTPDPVD